MINHHCLNFSFSNEIDLMLVLKVQIIRNQLLSAICQVIAGPKLKITLVSWEIWGFEQNLGRAIFYCVTSPVLVCMNYLRHFPAHFCVPSHILHCYCYNRPDCRLTATDNIH